MKKLFLFMLYLFFFSSITAQESHQLTKEDYLLRSKKQKTGGWAMIGGGSAMMLTGIIIATTAKKPTGNFEIFSEGQVAGMTIFMIGSLIDLASIPFFVTSGINARKAAKISFSNQQIILPHHKSFAVTSMPAITIKIRM